MASWPVGIFFAQVGLSARQGLCLSPGMIDRPLILPLGSETLPSMIVLSCVVVVVVFVVFDQSTCTCPELSFFTIVVVCCFCFVRPVNMHVWWTKQEEHSDELDDLEEAATAAAERAKKIAKEERGGLPEEGKGESGDVDADASKNGAGATEDTMSPERQLASKKKKVAAAFAKEKKARFDEGSMSGASQS